ncbi:hypothetical protein ACMD2_03716 [Ananas comosus]|uniref:Uncharacterized protein n=1 Tax=Ananas comosus TaxID=4615 RepID=A0A199VYS3_ANACO|nr:hypothetical protein ACMD2_03716 [Ananas comosus]
MHEKIHLDLSKRRSKPPGPTCQAQFFWPSQKNQPISPGQKASSGSGGYELPCLVTLAAAMNSFLLVNSQGNIFSHRTDSQITIGGMISTVNFDLPNLQFVSIDFLSML